MKARHRRRVHLALAIAWAGPGLILTILYASAVWWVAAMSLFANVYTCLSAFSAETPVEPEEPS